MRHEPEPASTDPEPGPNELPQPEVPAPEGGDEAAGAGARLRNLEVRDLRSDPGAVQRRGRGKGKARQPAGENGPGDSGGASPGRETEDFHLKFDWETVPLQHGELVLRELRLECEQGAKILQARMDANADAVVLCSNPDCERPIRNGAWASRHTHRDQQTGLLHTTTSCSERCHIINQRRILRPVQEHKGGGMVRG